MTIELDVLDKLKEKKVVRDDIVLLYAQVIYWGECVDVVKVNKAIMDKWSRSGLIYIKQEVWKELENWNKSMKRTVKGLKEFRNSSSSKEKTLKEHDKHCKVCKVLNARSSKEVKK